MGRGEIRVEADGVTEVGRRLVEPVQLDQRLAQVVVDFGPVGPEPQRLAEGVGRLLPLPLRQERAAQVGVGLGRAGKGPHRLPTHRRRFRKVAPLPQRLAQRLPRLPMVGLEAEGLAVAGRRLVALALGRQDSPPTVVRLGEVRRRCRASAISAPASSGRPSSQGQAQIVVSVGRVGAGRPRPHLQRAAEALDRLGEEALRRQGDAEVVVGGAVPRVVGHRRPQRLGRLGRPAGPPAEGAEQVPGLGVGRLPPQHLQVKPLCLRQVAGLVAPAGGVQGGAPTGSSRPLAASPSGTMPNAAGSIGGAASRGRP